MHYRRLALGALVAISAFGLVACAGGSSKPSAQSQESHTQQSGYAGLVAGQPAHSMSYSPTRDTINGWIDTWGQRGQLAFVYLLNSSGEKVGYFVFQGPPVTYCAALTPNYKFVNPSNHDANGSDLTVPAPAIDGVYYSGGQCTEYIGKDATTGQILDFTAGNGLNFVDSTQPLYLNGPAIPPLGPTTVASLHKNAKTGQYTK